MTLSVLTQKECGCRHKSAAGGETRLSSDTQNASVRDLTVQRVKGTSRVSGPQVQGVSRGFLGRSVHAWIPAESLDCSAFLFHGPLTSVAVLPPVPAWQRPSL